MNKTNWFPEIMYEEQEDGLSSKIPFIMVPKDESMPSLLYIFESKETGEYEPGNNGEELPIIEMDLHQYADMLTLKNNLDEQTYNVVRSALGLKDLQTAVSEGKKITDNVRKNLMEKT